MESPEADDGRFRPCLGCGVEVSTYGLPQGLWVYSRIPPPGWPHLGVPPWAVVLILEQPDDPKIEPFLAGPIIAHVCTLSEQRAVGREVVEEAEAIARSAASR